jgi:HlyD family type I secretion membrane fusion protein
MPPETTSNIPVSFHGPGKAALLILAGALLIFVLWATFAPLNSGAIAPGEIIPAGKTKTIQHLEGGIVSAIHVKEGQKVVAGQVLLELDDTEAKAQLAIATTDEAALGALLARLRAERDGTPWSLSPATSPSADNQARLFEGRRNALRKELEGFQQRIRDAKTELAGWQAKEIQLKMQLRNAEEESRINQGLFEKNFISRPRLLQLESRKAEVAGLIAENAAEESRARQKITDAEVAIEKLKHDWLNIVLEEFRKTNESMTAASERVRVAKDRLARRHIVAPQDGAVNGLRYTTVGGVVAPGAVVLDVTPSSDQLLVEGRLSPDDIDVVRPGLEARVRLTAYKTRRHFSLKGTVTQVSSDTFKDERSGASFYKIRVEIPESELHTVAPMTLVPGMLAQVEVVTGERTALRYILDPVIDSFHRAMKEK